MNMLVLLVFQNPEVHVGVGGFVCFGAHAASACCPGLAMVERA